MTAESTTHPFEIRIDEQQRLLVMTLRGVWDDAIFDRFAAAYLAAMEIIVATGDATYHLVDASDFPLQPAGIADRFPVLIQSARYPANHRSACVVPSIVSRTQAREGGDIVNARFFKTMADAKEWLFSSEA